ENRQGENVGRSSTHRNRIAARRQPWKHQQTKTDPPKNARSQRKRAAPRARQTEPTHLTRSTAPTSQRSQAPEPPRTPQAPHHTQNRKATQPYTATATNKRKKQHPNRPPKQP